MHELDHDDRATASFGELEPRQIEFIRVYLVNGMNGTKAAAEVFGMGYNAAANKAHTLLHDPRIASVISAEMQSRMRRLRVDGDWVLEQAVEVFHRCMQVEKLLDRDGNLTGEFRFDATNSLKALNLIGKHVNVRAFESVQEDNRKEQVLERLQRGRERSRVAQRQAVAALADLEDDTGGSGARDDKHVSFL